MKTKTRLMPIEAAKKTRKKFKRMAFDEKSEFILKMIEKNVDYHDAIHGHRGFGFTMSQVATMTFYAPSNALMNDLFRMCDEGMIFVETVRNSRCGLSPVQHIFYAPLSWNARQKKNVGLL